VIGDAAYHKHAGEGPRQYSQNSGKDRACISGYILLDRQTDKQTDGRTDRRMDRRTDGRTASSQYFATALAAEVIRWSVDFAT